MKVIMSQRESPLMTNYKPSGDNKIPIIKNFSLFLKGVVIVSFNSITYLKCRFETFLITNL